ncbi:MAG: ADP-forming succinate--CoA ligase subunit beta [Methylomonas sp.]|nr:MAG: ADP-forming succinate--CoA ligase subunit beta [Methylomonas sp.]PPD27860.1 MAG: ADP-forming succinate--CoA ligase subunit beta [Methylomonas sp.]PPD39970.1 MAG: ADP-forming succinate--CoA ligase subunit beta [Methylomonas sp.]PPD41050.1 MAG: ADP-forming succinate--CoA ligase subunit beta [Methylomonas sp.]PPD52036.1 MAG: ADP-forming succinate--CoA ligase subunit beta [Methylomonas sp.]
MNIHEYQAKQLFRDFAIPVPLGAVAHTADAAITAAQGIPGSIWVVKAQVHAGARGKAGGIKVARSLDEVKAGATSLLGTRLVTHQTDANGLPVDSVWVEQASAIRTEFYLSLLLDRDSERLVFIASAAGGMDIEAVAAETPEKIVKIKLHPAAGLQPYHGRQIADALGLAKEQHAQLHNILNGMVDLFLAKDCSQIEINPLIVTDEGDLVALDAKINFDDNAIALHPDIAALRDTAQEDAREAEAQQYDLNYITLSGNIGCMVNGAGLAMATMDMIKLKGGAPANFLDVGGGTNTEKVKEAFKLILSDSNVKAVLVNIFGGIVKCDVIAAGILAAVEEMHLTIPVVVRLEGTNVQQGLDMLKNSGLGLVAAEDLNQAAELAVTLAEGKHA